MLSVRFWGARGSIPCPGPDTVVYGGNTACLEIRADERLLIVDIGTGIRPLGDWLLKNELKKSGKIKADLFLTHTHWDHIFGFPMFSPIYIPGTELTITGPVSLGDESLESIIAAQLSYKHWPVRAGELLSRIEYRQIKETTLDLGGGLTVKSKFINHPVFCLGYKFSYQDKSITTVYDHEPFYNLFKSNPGDANYNEEAVKEGERAATEENAKIINFIMGTDILIHDAQYTDEEYAKHIGWGHASFSHAVDAKILSSARKVVFFHHDPIHTDSQLEMIEKQYAGTGGGEPDVMMAREGQTLYA